MTTLEAALTIVTKNTYTGILVSLCASHVDTTREMIATPSHLIIEQVNRYSSL